MVTRVPGCASETMILAYNCFASLEIIRASSPTKKPVRMTPSQV